MNHAISKATMSVPELALIAGTRAILGIGLGLLLADRLNLDQRKAVGWTMFAIGAISTIPLGIEIFGERLQSGKDQLRTAV
jgi:ABC-type dipeptide/oligopeptide/nickel transport system permease subunit